MWLISVFITSNVHGVNKITLCKPVLLVFTVLFVVYCLFQLKVLTSVGVFITMC